MIDFPESRPDALARALRCQLCQLPGAGPPGAGRALEASAELPGSQNAACPPERLSRPCRWHGCAERRARRCRALEAGGRSTRVRGVTFVTLAPRTRLACLACTIATLCDSWRRLCFRRNALSGCSRRPLSRRLGPPRRLA